MRQPRRDVCAYRRQENGVAEDRSDAFQYRGSAFLVRGEVDRAVDDLQTTRMFGLTVPSSRLSRTDEINRFDPGNVAFDPKQT